MIVKRPSGAVKPGDHFREVLATLYPTTARIDEGRIIDTLVGSHRGSGLVTVPVFLETFGQCRSNFRFILFTAGLRSSGRSSTRLRIQRANHSKKHPYSV
jgi:hypothetical protein